MGGVKSFTPLPHFTGSAWQGGPNWPDATLGWAQLTADGGHAGNDLEHAVIRRWIAPCETTVAISGIASHSHAEGDGIRAFIACSRNGELKSATLHNSTADMAIASLDVKQGDAIDFIVDFRENLNSDMFQWAPVISEWRLRVPAAAGRSKVTWDARKEFGGELTHRSSR
jgi:hypothetical protein